MITDFLTPNDARWRRFFDHAHHDAYHLPEYCRVAGNYEGGEPLAFYVEEGERALLIPLLVRGLPPELHAPADWCDATSPYGYSGPIATHGAGPDMLRVALTSLRAAAYERGIVSAFIRLHPFYSMPAAQFEEIGTVVHHGSVVYVDLAKSPVEWQAETRLEHRRNIARLIRLGYTVEMDDWAMYPEFRMIYRATMQRHNASPFYFFTDQYFDALREMLGDRLHLCTVHAPEGDVAASGLFMVVDGIAEYHLGGTAHAHLPKAPSKLMFDFVRGWAKALGARRLNLGGGIGGAAGSLHRFKSGFSPLEADFHTVRIIFDRDRYRQLTEASGEHALLDMEDAVSGFFPAYRRPPNARVGA
jgi:hypothetical protein